MEYLDEVPQTPAEKVAEEEVDQKDTLEEETSIQATAEAPIAKASEPQSPPTWCRFFIFIFCNVARLSFVKFELLMI